MYEGYQRKYEKRWLEYLTQRRQWIFLVNYDNILTAAVMKKADGEKGVKISGLKSMPGPISHSY